MRAAGKTNTARLVKKTYGQDHVVIRVAVPLHILVPLGD